MSQDPLVTSYFPKRRSFSQCSGHPATSRPHLDKGQPKFSCNGSCVFYELLLSRTIEHVSEGRNLGLPSAQHTETGASGVPFSLRFAFFASPSTYSSAVEYLQTRKSPANSQCFSPNLDPGPQIPPAHVILFEVCAADPTRR